LYAIMWSIMSAVPTRANGQAAKVAYRRNAQKRCYIPEALEVLALKTPQ
jgi:hypothetical protein